MTSDARDRRAADRKRRRNGKPEAEHVEDAAELIEGLKNAASAAAVGAAVGAARALNARRGRRPASAEEDGLAADEPEEEEEPDVETDSAEPEAAEREPDRAESIEPASPDALRSHVREAKSLLRELLGFDAESVSSVHRTTSGWKVGLVVVEVRRIPDSTDILATYDVQFDEDGGVLGIERTRRYHRSEADRGGRP
jgi:multidrug efflux pump subunit AcrA (membrane-fusion protein)